MTPDGERVTDARTLAGQIALAKSMRKYNLRRVISFHSRVERCAQVQPGRALCARVDARTRETAGADLERARFGRDDQWAP